MGVSPYVNYLYSDLSDGLIIFQLYDIIRPGVVSWERVIKKFNKLRVMLEKIGKHVQYVCLGLLSLYISLMFNGCEL